MSSASEIERQIREAARKMRAEDSKRTAEEKSHSVNTAIERQIQIEQDIKRKRTDYAKIFVWTFSGIAIAVLWVLIWLTANSVYFSEEDPWRRPVHDKRLPPEVGIFIEQIILDAKNIDAVLKKYFSSSSPEHWRVMAGKSLSDLDLKSFKTRSVAEDKKEIGSAPHFIVLCSSAKSDSEIIFSVESNAGEFSINRVKIVSRKDSAK